MSVKRSITTYGIAAIVIASALIGVSMVFVPGATTTIPGQNTSTTTALKAPTLSIPLLLTDPPIVPVGTQSLNLTFNGAEVGIKSNQSENEWVKVNASGSVNLLELVNVSKTIGLAQVPQGSVIDQMKFNIASVKIDVNNTIYNVTTVSNSLVVPVAGGASIQQLSSVLMDLTSHVVEIYTGNSSAPVFVLIPNAVAIVRLSSVENRNESEVGTLSNLTSDERHQLDQAKGIVNVLASLSVSGNATNMSIAIYNTGNVSVALQAVNLEGQFNYSSGQSLGCQVGSAPDNMTTQHSDNLPMSGQDESVTTETSNSTTTSVVTQSSNSRDSNDSESGYINQTTITTTSVETNSSYHETESRNSTTFDNETTTVTSSHYGGEDGSGFSCSDGSQFDTPHSMVFIPNGTSLVPLTGEDIRSGNQVIIPPKSTVTFTFSGAVIARSGDSQQLLSLYPIAGNSYQLGVELSNDASTTTSVTAS